MLLEIFGVSVVNDYIFKVKFSKLVFYFFSLIVNFSLFLVLLIVVEKYGSDWIKVGNLVGNGVFKL